MWMAGGHHINIITHEEDRRKMANRLVVGFLGIVWLANLKTLLIIAVGVSREFAT